VKVAIVGSASSSAGLAPYDDPEWTIWGCSPGAVPYLRRVDAYFELHKWRAEDYDHGLIEWMRQTSVYVAEPVEALPSAKDYPTQEILAEYTGLAQSFFSSSIAWMLALAIRDGATEIALFGVDMADPTEYAHQKPGCHFFILEAERRGIKVTVPPESDLLRPLPLYGIGETGAMRVKLASRRRELEGRLCDVMRREQEADTAYQNLVRERFYLQGALSDLEYTTNTWT
jgi:hypothetical protein